LGCENHPYNLIQEHGQEKTWVDYSDNNKNSIYYFYYKDDISAPYIKDNKYIYLPGKENLDNCTKKTVDAFKYVLENFEFTYIYRTNISSYINKRLLDAYINTLYNTNIYGGVINNKDDIAYASGSGFIISKDLVKLLVDNEDKIDYSIVDDMSIGKFLNKQNNISIIPIPRIDIINDNGLKRVNNTNINNAFHYRLKSYYETNRNFDIQAMHYLHNLLKDKN
jgi:hypothetical protein